MQNDNLKPGLKESMPLPDIEKGEIATPAQKHEVPGNFENREQVSSDEKKFSPSEGTKTDERTNQGIVAATNKQTYLSDREKKVEKILERDLDDIYLAMSPDKKLEFKKAGEKAAKEINNQLSNAKIKIKKIVNIIKNWLSVIPGVNKFFLEKMAKIKSDEIIKIKNSNG